MKKDNGTFSSFSDLLASVNGWGPVTYILVLLQVATLSQVKVKLSRTFPHLHWIALFYS